jgi:hypothetical protein
LPADNSSLLAGTIFVSERKKRKRPDQREALADNANAANGKSRFHGAILSRQDRAFVNANAREMRQWMRESYEKVAFTALFRCFSGLNVDARARGIRQGRCSCVIGKQHRQAFVNHVYT